MQENDSYILIEFGKHLRALREAKGVSSAEMARRCFMDRGNYTRIETGKTNPTLITLKKICDALEISYTELFINF